MRDASALEHRVEEILRKLPVIPGVEKHIPFAAAALVHFARLPRGNPLRGDKAAIRELADLAIHLRAAQSALENLSAEASVALSREPVDINDAIVDTVETADISRFMARLERQVVSAKEKLEVKPLQRHAKPRRKLDAYFTTIALLGFYEELTGMKATVKVDAYKRGHPRSGEFLNLVAEVLGTLGIKASPSAQAAVAVERDYCSFLGMEFEDLLEMLTFYKSRRGLPRAAP
jgi:hypothetical protein